MQFVRRKLFRYSRARATSRTSNAYRPTLPARILAYLPRWLRPAPIPDDAFQHAQARAEGIAVMHANLSCRELARATVGGALGRVLARLGVQIDGIERECQNDPEPLMESYETGFGESARPTSTIETDEPNPEHPINPH